MGFDTQITCHSLICVDIDRLFGSDPDSLPGMKTTGFVVAEGLLSCAFTQA